MRRAGHFNSSGSVLVTTLLVLVLIAALAFGIWAFEGRQDYKNNTDKKITAAVATAEAAQKAQLQKDFSEQAKSPYKTYKGSSTYGTITFNYPNNWSAYIDETNISEPINGYFYPNQVPSVQGNTAFALRLELLATPYNQVLQQYSSFITAGKLTATAYVPPKMAGVANVQPGTKLVGAINQNQQGSLVGSMVVIKVRDKTLKIYAESTDFLADFNKMLDSLTFAP